MLNLFKPRSLGARIIAINFIGLILLALGFIYVDKSEDNLVKARIEALLVQANLFAFSFDLDPEIQMISKIVNHLVQIFEKHISMYFLRVWKTILEEMHKFCLKQVFLLQISMKLLMVMQ